MPNGSASRICCPVSASQVHKPRRLHRPARPVACPASKAGCCRAAGHQPRFEQADQAFIALFEMAHPDGGIDQHAHGAGTWRWRGASSISGTWPPKAARRLAACCRIKAWRHSRSSSDFSMPGGARPRALANRASSMVTVVRIRAFRGNNGGIVHGWILLFN